MLIMLSQDRTNDADYVQSVLKDATITSTED